jgi:oxygen-independent coproporphyrinogen-3 oxidase
MALSLYVHVPFCRSRCRYCAFYSGEPLGLLPAYPSWVAAEAALRATLPGALAGPATTAYFGGGTSALLGARGIATVLAALDRAWGLAPAAEVTVEANPAGDLDLAGLRLARVNRLSLGVQCLHDPLLARLGRPHTARQALHAVEAAASRFPSVSADLLLGLPGVRPAAVARWVTALREAGATHVSTYSLEVHPGTPLAQAVADGSFSLPSAEEEEDQWAAADDALVACGLRAYEVSNSCLPGHECRHNLAYWDQSPYVGLGPGAHAFDPAAGPWGTRSWNEPDLAAYADRLGAGILPPGGREALAAPQSLLESLFLSLRRPEPIDFDRLCRRHGGASEHLLARLQEVHAAGLLASCSSPQGTLWRPTREGLRRADGLALWLSEAAIHP